MGPILLSLSLAAHLFAAEEPPIDYSDAYRACTKAVPEDVLTKCEEPARAGIPGAQYVLGVAMINRGKGDDVAHGVEWLEKAVAAGSPNAAYHLATVLLEKNDEASAKRASELLRTSICAGYPQAIAAMNDAGVKREEITCPAASETDFTGDWMLHMKWDKPVPATPDTTYKLSIAKGAVQVSMEIGGTWTEIKKGEFAAAQTDESMTVAETDTGWDHDGKWIESWTFQLMRTGPDTASVAFMHTVNNPHLPARFRWKTASFFAQGTAERLK